MLYIIIQYLYKKKNKSKHSVLINIFVIDKFKYINTCKIPHKIEQ